MQGREPRPYPWTNQPMKVLNAIQFMAGVALLALSLLALALSPFHWRLLIPLANGVVFTVQAIIWAKEHP